MLLDLATCVDELLKAPNLHAMGAAAKVVQAPVATVDEAKALYQRLPGYISANDHRNAVACTLALLRLEGSVWLARMRKDGLFRASRYGYDSRCLMKIVAAALELSASASLQVEQIGYLKSLQALLELARPAKQIHLSIVNRLRARKSTALKTLLAFVNAMFSSNWMGDEQADESQPLRWSATHLASAFSRLYMIARDDLGIDAQTWNRTDDHAASAYEAVYSSLIMDALRINELIDAEVLLDGLPYKAEATPKGVLVSAIDPAFERSVRLGYIQSDLQLWIRAASAQQHLTGEQPTLGSFDDALSPLFDTVLLECVSLETVPGERLVIRLPSFPQLIEVLNFGGPFLDEMPFFVGAHIDNFQAPGTMLQVSEQLSIMDLIKAKRVFNLIDAMFVKKLETLDDLMKRRVLRLRSTVIVATRTHLLGMLQLVMSHEKALELISLLSLPTTSSMPSSNEYVDLQYRPFLRSLSTKGDFIAIPPAVVAKSNLVRSIMHASRIKEATAAADDPMQVAVAAALRKAGLLVRESFVFNINGRRETDIFCFGGGVLFVIECKNAYHPCSPHELRNSYDLVLKAEEQLDIRAQWLDDPSNQMRLFKAMRWNVTAPARVRTCVVTANRAFSGYRCGAHPVRQAHELINVLVRGYVGRGPDGPNRRFWRAEHFEVADLLDYLEAKSVLQPQHAAMAPSKRGILLRGRRLEFAEFSMDLEDMGRHVEETFSEICDAKPLGDGAYAPL